MKKILAIIMAFVVSTVVVSAPVEAYSPVGMYGETVATNVLDKCGKESSGEGKIVCILKLAVEILSIGVGILGVIGISVSGVQYLTAGGNEEQTRKAKRRLFEIVLGLAAYAVLFAFLSWLLPNF